MNVFSDLVHVNRMIDPYKLKKSSTHFDDTIELPFIGQKLKVLFFFSKEIKFDPQADKILLSHLESKYNF